MVVQFRADSVREMQEENEVDADDEEAGDVIFHCDDTAAEPKVPPFLDSSLVRIVPLKDGMPSFGVSKNVWINILLRRPSWF